MSMSEDGLHWRGHVGGTTEPKMALCRVPVQYENGEDSNPNNVDCRRCAAMLRAGSDTPKGGA